MKYYKIMTLVAAALVSFSAAAQNLESIYKSLPVLDKSQMMDIKKTETSIEQYKLALDKMQEDMMAIANLKVEASKAIQTAASKTPKASPSQMSQMSAMSSEVLKELQKRGISLDQFSNMSDEEIMELMMPIIQQMNGGQVAEIKEQDDDGVISDADSKIIDQMNDIEENINEIVMELGLKVLSDDCEGRYERKAEGEFYEMWLPYEEKVQAIERELYMRVEQNSKDGNAIPTPAYASDYYNRMNDEVKAYNTQVVDKWCGYIDPEIEAVKKVLDSAMPLYAEWFKMRETLSTDIAKGMSGVEAGFTSIHALAEYYVRLLKAKAGVPVHAAYQIPKMIGGMM